MRPEHFLDAKSVWNIDSLVECRFQVEKDRKLSQQGQGGEAITSSVELARTRVKIPPALVLPLSESCGHQATLPRFHFRAEELPPQAVVAAGSRL